MSSGLEAATAGERGVLVAVTLGTILAPLNSTIIAVALPEIAGEFDASIAEVGWLVSAYLLAIAILQPFAGRLGDRIGRRRLMLLGLAGFGGASLGAALAPTLGLLLLFRVLQAIAGALTLPNGVALLRLAVPAERRARAFAAVWAAAGAAAAAGPTIGGVMIEGAGWRAAFYASVAVAGVAAAYGWRVLPRREERARREGARLVAVLRVRPFVAANAGIALGNLAFYTTLVATPILLVDDAGWTSLEAGLALTALAAPSVLLSPVGGRLADRYGRRLPALAGLTLAAVALLPLAFGASGPPALLATLVVSGVGFGLAFASLQTAAVEAVPPEHAGVASGVFSTSRYAGSIVGSLALGALLVTGTDGVSGFQALAGLVAGAALLAAVSALGVQSGPVELQDEDAEPATAG